LCAALAGCVVEPASTGTTEAASVIDNKLSANKLSANKLSANKLSANKLSANKLSANRLVLDEAGTEGLIETADGREVLSFIISCAIPEGITLVREHDGETYEFFGELGLAPRWIDRPLDRKGKGWVSACLFARVNNANVTIPVSLRGKHAALAVTPDEAEHWTVEEGAFYGNFFTAPDEPIEWIACRGVDQAAGESGGLVERDCAEPDPANPGFTLCGFKYAGDCFNTKPQRGTCAHFDAKDTHYVNCGASQLPGGPRYQEVITTYVIP
jgi:hypothetical protein